MKFSNTVIFPSIVKYGTKNFAFETTSCTISNYLKIVKNCWIMPYYIELGCQNQGFLDNLWNLKESIKKILSIKFTKSNITRKNLHYE